jgi:hypothetical protein
MGVVLSVCILLVLLFDFAMHGLTQSATARVERHLDGQAVTLVLSIAGTTLLASRRVESGVAALVFGMAGVLMLWSAYVGSWRGAQLILAAGCFGLSALAFAIRSRR